MPKHESWLDDPPGEWLEVIDEHGDPLGFLRRSEASRMKMPIQVIETPDRYLTDPYVLYHAQLAYERGMLNRGRDLNDIQVILLASHIIKKREFEKAERERVFEERFFAANPEGYKDYIEKKKQKDENEGDIANIEQRIPRSIEEFLADVQAFGSEDEASTQDKGQSEATEGWLSSILDDSELEQMSDDEQDGQIS